MIKESYNLIVQEAEMAVPNQKEKYLMLPSLDN